MGLCILVMPRRCGSSWQQAASAGMRGAEWGAADETTGHDARLFLQRLLERFPRLRDAPLWLSGESFGVRRSGPS